MNRAYLLPLGLVSAAALSACQVNVDNKSKENVENAADSAGAALGKAADTADNLADKAAKKVENAADAAADKVSNTHVNVNLGGEDDHDSNKSKHK